ncbi:SA1362 family protein [Virgibacillus alimentarius]|uniref:Uncharacterized membrane protein YgaE (UPF0421/DUF939 family) n=2 Tax=Virgibacillus alimentarius TaxID=698769 RepID=A0ABS4S4R6_9BACI|nr:MULTISPECIES: SA1362 family protein [Virgibacillus]MBP2256487.1 uncharacterized membrane protein YgaE (UPF0421/DUF939 family) [Virgibacillus alimentarius]HLR66432.1 SA1362 family protein [Virgibacillus sp.]
MARNKLTFLVYIIIGLALIGVVTQLYSNATSFLANLFLMIGIGVAVFAAIYFLFLRNRAPSNDMKKYKKAVKQSKAKYKQRRNPNIKTSTRKNLQSLQVKKKPSRRASHLRVIEGNKSKKKKRASN